MTAAGKFKTEISDKEDLTKKGDAVRADEIHSIRGKDTRHNVYDRLDTSLQSNFAKIFSSDSWSRGIAEDLNLLCPVPSTDVVTHRLLSHRLTGQE